MLLKSRISDADLSTEEWKQLRLGRFTSSNIYKICGERGLGDEGMNYIRTRVFESLSGVPTDKEFLNESAANGLVNEGFALRKFAAKMGLTHLVVQKLIFGPDEYTSTTPDALIVRKGSSDGLSIDCSIAEVKSFEAAMHVLCASCETPQELRDAHKKTYWQVLDQMLVADTLEGYAIFDNPELPEDKGGHRIIHFRKMQQLGLKDNKPFYPIVADLAFLIQRKAMAMAEFHKIKAKLTGIAS
jgi:hypothetical protein